jgi:hypothetical protein
MMMIQLNAQATGLTTPAHFALRPAFSVTAGVRFSALS